MSPLILLLECGSGRMVKTGHLELLTTFSSTEPKRMRSIPVRPWVPMMMRSAFSSSARLSISRQGSPPAPCPGFPPPGNGLPGRLACWYPPPRRSLQRRTRWSSAARESPHTAKATERHRRTKACARASGQAFGVIGQLGAVIGKIHRAENLLELGHCRLQLFSCCTGVHLSRLERE